jgi:AcrR family transcriptional regulator
VESARHRLLSRNKGTRRRPGRPTFNSAETRQALLDAAEELFATFGVEGVSIRSINAAAGFGPATVHRHFGSKDRLLEAVLRRRADGITAHRNERLAVLEATVRPPTALDLIEAFATPYRELVEHDAVGGLRWLQLMARLVLAADPRLIKLSFELHLHERVRRVLHLVFPGVPMRQLERELGIAIGTLIHLLANRGIWTPHGGAKHGDHSAKTDVDKLVRFVAAGLTEMIAAEREGSSHRPRHISHHW